jgi:hypothetical protein
MGCELEFFFMRFFGFFLMKGFDGAFLLNGRFGLLD